jgi:hypothetical protein
VPYISFTNQGQGAVFQRVSDGSRVKEAVLRVQGVLTFKREYKGLKRVLGLDSVALPHTMRDGTAEMKRHASYVVAQLAQRSSSSSLSSC